MRMMKLVESFPSLDVKLKLSRIHTAVRVRRICRDKNRSGSPILCNLGCGERHHPDWINLDIQQDGDSVLSWDLRKQLPFPNHSCDVVYSSHIIEHFSRENAKTFLLECHRILKKGGIIRLVAPDLEEITRTYISCLDRIKQNDVAARDEYEWIIIELLDQLVRHQSGGEMVKYWCKPVVPAESFVDARVGTEYRRARARLMGRKLSDRSASAQTVGRFRLSGEVHQWMYDRWSMTKLVSECGFCSVRSCAADESAIKDFSSFFLDTDPDGTIYKPDSFFTEAKAP